MSDLIKLRVMTTQDAHAVAALVRAAFAAQAVVTDPLPSALRLNAEDVARHLRAGGSGAVAQAAQRIVGSAMWSAQDGGLSIARVAVEPAWRRQGIAGLLLRAAEDAARALGVPFLHLATRLVLTDNRALFAGCGFVEVSRHAHPGYAEPTWVAMQKRL